MKYKAEEIPRYLVPLIEEQKPIKLINFWPTDWPDEIDDFSLRSVQAVRVGDVWYYAPEPE